DDGDAELPSAPRTLDGSTVPFAPLSAGAGEQLAIITRLACAAVVDPEQGVPVIIDDALGYSDPERLAAMNTMIGSLAADAQVILLTCTPDRYRGIGSASVLRLARGLPAPRLPGSPAPADAHTRARPAAPRQRLAHPSAARTSRSVTSYQSRSRSSTCARARCSPRRAAETRARTPSSASSAWKLTTWDHTTAGTLTRATCSPARTCTSGTSAAATTRRAESCSPSRCKESSAASTRAAYSPVSESASGP